MSQQPANHTKLTPPELAAQWGISPEKVLGWIRAGELRAINLAAHRGGRPRYKIDVRDIEAFEERRTVEPPAKRLPGRPKRPEGVIEFF